MEQKLAADRHLRHVENPSLRVRENAIQRIQTSYGYGRDDAEKVYELMRVRQVEQMWGLGCGAFAAYKWMPIQREMEASNAMLRKAWMRYPMVASAFGMAYFVGMQLPTRFFAKFTHRNVGIDSDTYKGQHDLVSRFRLFEEGSGQSSSAEDALLDKMAIYDKDALSKPELLDHLMKRISE